MKRLSSFVFIISFIIAQAAVAETPIGQTASAPAPVPNMNINQTAKQASGSAAQAMIANGISAAGFIAAAMAASPPQKPIFYAMAAASVASGFMMGGGKKNANAIDSATYGASSAGGGNDGIDGPTSGFVTGAGGYEDLVVLEQQLADKGYVMSADGSSISTPGGEVSTAAIASGNAPGFEMTDDVKATVAAIAEDAMKKASGNKVVAVGLQDGGGGGGGAGFAAAEESSSKFDMSKYLRGLKNRDPSNVSGLSKKLGDDNIGIKSDNIFEMVSRQYKRKQSQSAFIK